MYKHCNIAVNYFTGGINSKQHIQMNLQLVIKGCALKKEQGFHMIRT